MLELESGSNDPMAYVLVITLIGLIQVDTEPNYWMAALTFFLQLGIGGFSIGVTAGDHQAGLALAAPVRMGRNRGGQQGGRE